MNRFFQRANTLAATVNIITKEINGAELVFSTGNDLPYSATVMAGRQFAPDRSISFSFTTEQKEGFDAWSPDFRPNLAGGRETGELENGNYFSVLSGRSGEWSAQIIAYKTIFPELLINNGSPLNDGTYTDEMYSIYAKNEHEIDLDLTSFFNTSASYKRSSRLNSGGLPQPDTAAELYCAQRVYDMELGLRYAGFQKHLIQTGIQTEYQDNSSEKNWFTWNAVSNLPSFPGETLLYDKNIFATGFYISDNYTADDQLEFINGIRTDTNTTLGSEWYIGGSSAVVYHPTESWTTKLVYNRSVRFPTSYAANNKAWGQGKDGPSWTRHFPNVMEPEILSTVEWQNILYIDRFRLGLTPYYQDLSDFISWSEPHSNVGNFRGYGIEGDIQAQLTPDVVFWANTSFNNSELHAFNVAPPTGSLAEDHHALVNEDNRIVGSAKIVANTGIDWTLSKNVIFSATVRYFTNQVAHDYTTSRYIEINNRYYLDAALLWKNAFGKDMDLRLSGTNILDNRKPVGGQWLGDTYKPRGATFVISAYIQF